MMQATAPYARIYIIISDDDILHGMHLANTYRVYMQIHINRKRIVGIAHYSDCSIQTVSYRIGRTYGPLSVKLSN